MPINVTCANRQLLDLTLGLYFAHLWFRGRRNTRSGTTDGPRLAVVRRDDVSTNDGVKTTHTQEKPDFEFLILPWAGDMGYMLPRDAGWWGKPQLPVTQAVTRVGNRQTTGHCVAGVF